MCHTLDHGLLVELAPLASGKRTHGYVVSVRPAASDLEVLAARAWLVQFHESIRLLDAVRVGAYNIIAGSLEAWEDGGDLRVVIPRAVAEVVGNVPRRVGLSPFRCLRWSLAVSLALALAVLVLILALSVGFLTLDLLLLLLLLLLDLSAASPACRSGLGRALADNVTASEVAGWLA
eukprot:SAG11_NODE_1140_length_5709_cov_11.137611_6_plen_177_part_00